MDPLNFIHGPSLTFNAERLIKTSHSDPYKNQNPQ
jgi:hypothetical protein